MTMDYQIEVYFDKGYIGHPYWPERERLINIQKESGTKRARSEEKAKAALNSYLIAKGMSWEDYEELDRLASRQFYMNGGGEIVIPAHQVYGALAQTADIAPAAIRIAKTEQIRTILRTSNWATGKRQPDGVWERFVVVTGAQGKLSNQRALRSNEYITDFRATGQIHVIPDIPGEKIRQFLEYCGREIGVGASRKLAWGRFTILECRAMKRSNNPAAMS